MGKEDDPFTRLRSGDNLTFGGKPMLDVGGEIPRTPEIFISFSITEEASHLPLEPAPAMVGVGGGEKDGDFAGTESLGDWKAEEM